METLNGTIATLLLQGKSVDEIVDALDNTADEALKADGIEPPKRTEADQDLSRAMVMRVIDSFGAIADFYARLNA